MTTDKFWIAAKSLKLLSRFPLTRGLSKRLLSFVCECITTSNIFVNSSLGSFIITLDLKIPADREIYLFGIIDPRGVRSVQLVMSLINCRSACDIGSNRGNHSAFMIKECHRLFLFEPNPVEFKRSQFLTKSNENITIFNIGLSNVNGFIPFHVNKIDSGGSTFEMNGRSASFNAPVRTGDEFFRENQIDDIDFLKIDVEGHEAKVLSGLTETIRNMRPIISMEILSRYKLNKQQLLDLLPNYLLLGNKIGILSSIFRTRYTFCEFKDGETYMSALMVPLEKRHTIKNIIPH